MNDEGLSREQLVEELQSLRDRVSALTAEKAELDAQQSLIENLGLMTQAYLDQEDLKSPSNKHKLIANLLNVIHSSTDEGILQQSLQSVLDTLVELTTAQKGSLFLLDDRGKVTYSILTREDSSPGQRDNLIDQVLERGLAGWVYQNRQVGLIVDTKTDERWLDLPNQPYTARSALAVPILRGTERLALITLLHSEPGHFSSTAANLIQITANQIALTLEMIGLKVSFNKEQSASELQRQLLENLVERGSDSKEGEILKTTLQKIVDLSADLTGAETSSLFLLDMDGRVADAILSRTEVTPQQRSKLIGNVLDKGLAGWVNSHHTIGLITDTEKDERWLTLPNQPYTVRSALAVPILRGGQLHGILTLLHSQPAFFDLEIAEQMRFTADHIALVLENVRLYSKLDQYSKLLDSELQKGRKIQLDFLPYTLCQPDNWEIAAAFYPARQVAGDYYDAFALKDTEHIGLVIADVCDKGVGAALFMALFRSLIRIFSSQSNLNDTSIDFLNEAEPVPQGWLGSSVTTNLAHLNALKAVKLTNDYVAKYHYNMCMFVTMFFGVLEPSTGLLTYINGGHESLFVLANNGEIKHTLESTGPAVGMMPNSQFKIQQIRLEPGDILMGYTDGVTEGKNVDGEQFKMERLRPLLTEPSNSASHLLERIKQKLFEYIGDAPQFDDITMIAIRHKS